MPWADPRPPRAPMAPLVGRPRRGPFRLVWRSPPERDGETSHGGPSGIQRPDRQSTLWPASRATVVIRGGCARVWSSSRPTSPSPFQLNLRELTAEGLCEMDVVSKSATGNLLGKKGARINPAHVALPGRSCFHATVHHNGRTEKISPPRNRSRFLRPFSHAKLG